MNALLILSWIAMTGMFSSSFYAFSYVAKFDMPVDFMMFYRMMIACLVVFFIIRLKKQRFLIKKSEVLLSVLVSVSQLNVYLSGYATKYIISGLVPCILLAQIFVAEFLVSIYEKRRMHGNIILSGIIFGLAHITDPSNMTELLFSIPYIVMGIIFALIYSRTNNIFTTITFHLCHNLILLIIQFL